MPTFSEQDHRRKQWIAGNWCLRDDDVPTWREPSPISSAQHRRWWRSELATQASWPQG